MIIFTRKWDFSQAYRIPNTRSIKKPPKKHKTTFGQEYQAYSSMNFVVFTCISYMERKQNNLFSKQLSVAIKTFFLVVEAFLNHLLLLSALASTSRKMVTPGNFLSLQSFQRLHGGQHPSALALWGSLLPTSACIFYISIPCVLPAVGLHPHEKGQSLAYPFLLPH